MGGGMDIRGEYRFSSRMKQNKKGKNLLRHLHRRKKKIIILYLRCDCEAKNL